MSKIVVRQKKSLIGTSRSLRKIVSALGLGKIGQERTHKDNNCTRGMVNKVKHLVDYELVSE